LAPLFFAKKRDGEKVKWTHLSRQFFIKIKLHLGAVLLFFQVQNCPEPGVIHSQRLTAALSPFLSCNKQPENGRMGKRLIYLSFLWLATMTCKKGRARNGSAFFA
jgi:hypothetical protein